MPRLAKLCGFSVHRLALIMKLLSERGMGGDNFMINSCGCEAGASKGAICAASRGLWTFAGLGPGLGGS